MHCPKCRAAKTEVLDTDRRTTFIRRRRFCPSCGENFATDEILSGRMDRIRKIEAVINSLRLLLKEAF